MTIVTKKIDDITITALSDGVLTTSLDVVLGMERDEKERLAGLKTTDPLPIAVNAFLLERGGRARADRCRRRPHDGADARQAP